MTYDTINDALTIAANGKGTLLAGRYRVVRQLGQGGMGSVWLAEDMQLDNKPFAIKMLPAILVANKRAYRQLKDEALVAMRLVHPNIVQIRAFEENDGNPFLVMDYVDGQTLDDYLADYNSRVEHVERVKMSGAGRDARPFGGLPESDVLRILRPVAAALDYAHGEGVVHRDVKPANVMIRKDGHPYILDFGIAREIQETLTRVTGKLSGGTLLYMSPEQLHGATPKKEQDIYSFAAMAYECLKGEPPFARGQIEYQIDNDMPEPLVLSTDETPVVPVNGRGARSPSGALASGVMAGLAKRPEDRPKSCMAVLGGLRLNHGTSFAKASPFAKVTGNGGHMPPVATPRMPLPPRPRNLGGKWKMVAAVAAAFFVLVGGWMVMGRSRTQEPPPVTREVVDLEKSKAENWLLALSGVSSKIGGVEATREECKQLMASAQTAYETGDWREAKSLYDKVIGKASRAMVSSGASVSAAEMQEKVKAAREAALTTGAEKYGKVPLAEAERLAADGDRAIADGRFDEAVALLDKAKEKFAEAAACAADAVSEHARTRQKACETERSAAQSVFASEFARQEWNAAEKAFADGKSALKDGNAVLAEKNFTKAQRGYKASAVKSQNVQLVLLKSKTEEKKSSAEKALAALRESEAEKYGGEAFDKIVAQYAAGTNLLASASYADAGSRFDEVCKAAPECESAIAAAKGRERARMQTEEKKLSAEKALAALRESEAEKYGGEAFDKIVAQYAAGTNLLASASYAVAGSRFDEVCKAAPECESIIAEAKVLEKSRMQAEEKKASAEKALAKLREVGAEEYAKESFGKFVSLYAAGTNAFANASYHYAGAQFDEICEVSSELEKWIAERKEQKRKMEAIETAKRNAFAAQQKVLDAGGNERFVKEWNKAVNVLKRANEKYVANDFVGAKSSFEYALQLFTSILKRRDAGQLSAAQPPPMATELPAVQGNIEADAPVKEPEITPKPIKGLAETARAVFPLNPKHGQEFSLTLPGGARIAMIYVAPGSFKMGSLPNEDDQCVDALQHDVTLTKGYWLGKYEVTQAQWRSVMGENPSGMKDDRLPATNMSWEDCQLFIQKINEQTAYGVRLPTEAEWEYACRAGTTGPYGGNGNLDDMGWFDVNSGKQPHPAGQKCPNAWGFYDMHGNVHEWCMDVYGTYDRKATDPTGPTSTSIHCRVVRGGCWDSSARNCRSAQRAVCNPKGHNGFTGLRLACTAGLQQSNEILRVTSERTVQARPEEHIELVMTNGNCQVSCSNVIHVVRRGEHLSNIAVKYNVEMSAIIDANPGLDPRRIRFGMQLKIPIGKLAVTTVGTETVDKMKEAKEPKAGETKTITLPGGVTMEMIYVAPGSFTMGSPAMEGGRYGDETQHRVTLTKGYWLGKYEVTQRQWESVMGWNPSSWKNDDLPIEAISWNDCQQFISKVNSQLNCGARLPTEAEWEYACRAGTTGQYGGNGCLDDMGWYRKNSGHQPHPVGYKSANAWGFHDMHGNMLEWCNDWKGKYEDAVTDPTGPVSGEYRVLRGGSWENIADWCASSCRYSARPSHGFSVYGFRLACSAGPRE